jgi:hypothetical protein
MDNKSVVVCGKTPDGENVYTDGKDLYTTNDEQYFYKYHGKLIATVDKEGFKAMYGHDE